MILKNLTTSSSLQILFIIAMSLNVLSVIVLILAFRQNLIKLKHKWRYYIVNYRTATLYFVIDLALNIFLAVLKISTYIVNYPDYTVEILWIWIVIAVQTIRRPILPLKATSPTWLGASSAQSIAQYPKQKTIQ
jgi:hypothetical protein